MTQEQKKLKSIKAKLIRAFWKYMELYEWDDSSPSTLVEDIDICKGDPLYIPLMLYINKYYNKLRWCKDAHKYTEEEIIRWA
jgi:hypothetical protein